MKNLLTSYVFKFRLQIISEKKSSIYHFSTYFIRTFEKKIIHDN